MAGNAPDFQKFISDARERKRNEALADKIFSRDRRQSAPSKLKHAPGGSLASRVGVNKKQRVSSANWNKHSEPQGNVDGEWTHDLHDLHESVNQRRPASTALESRISHPSALGNNRNSKPPSKRNTAAQRRDRLASAVDRMDVDQVNVVSSPSSGGMGITIRGLAGPFAVMGQNFAPGTTAADIESAVTPIGGEMVSCRIVKTTPFIMAEMVFVSREGSERVIKTFNDMTADGRLLKVYPKIGGYQPSTPSTAAPTGPANGTVASRNPPRERVADSGVGCTTDLFGDKSNSLGGPGRPLYSDKIVARNQRGRGFRRGG
ncbi:hypothetical protein HIM_04489 [Hirsutella minnesotensis 3608]|uniref:RRM domain-containing protein n=1 Tax=Hirsutella minnesotensis 3608 TaxID=1043627 RepID=A0A0F7ZV57_9HYPO|nr:hypothetical protein HIM_04489 [Hirsutella minnesotensis 3608]